MNRRVTEVKGKTIGISTLNASLFGTNRYEKYDNKSVKSIESRQSDAEMCLETRH